MAYCCVPFCKSRSKKSNVSFHEFPSDDNLRLRWIINIARKGEDGGIWIPSEYSKVCSLHFKPEDYKEGKIKNLKSNTVPSVFNGYPKSMRPESRVSRLKGKTREAISRKEENKNIQKNKDPVLNS